MTLYKIVFKCWPLINRPRLCIIRSTIRTITIEIRIMSENQQKLCTLNTPLQINQTVSWIKSKFIFSLYFLFYTWVLFIYKFSFFFRSLQIKRSISGTGRPGNSLVIVRININSASISWRSFNWGLERFLRY